MPSIDPNQPAGAVDQHVDPAELLFGRTDRALYLRGISDIERDDQNAVTVLLGPRRQLVGTPGGEHYAVSRLQCGLGKRDPETAGRVPPVMNHRRVTARSPTG